MTRDPLWPWALTLSAALPMLLYTLTAAPGPYWLDSGELAAAAFLAGTPHPPGHPLYVALTNPAGLLPFGAVALRMNLTSAAAMALCCALLAHLARRLLVHLGAPPRRATLAALAAALLTASSYALWFQAVRAEVYALHLLCAALITSFAVEMEIRALTPALPRPAPRAQPDAGLKATPEAADEPATDDAPEPAIASLEAAHTDAPEGALSDAPEGSPSDAPEPVIASPVAADARLLFALAFTLGLALANHHYLVLFVAAPVLALILARRVWRRALLSTAGLRACGFGLFGLACYALLPLRALRDPFVNWGDPDNPRDFWWVITAQAFQKSLERAQQVDVPQLLVDLGVQIGRQLTPVGLVLALVALGWLLRRPERRGLGLLLGALVAFNLVTQSLMNFDPFNPDVHGYFALSVWTLGLLVALSWGALELAAAHIRDTQPRAQGRAASLMATGALIGLGAMAAVNTATTLDDARLDGFHDVELASMAMLDPMPEGAVVLTSSFKTIFNLWFDQGVAHRRPDVAVIHRNFLPTPSYAREIRARHPELAALVGERDGNTGLDTEALLAMAAERPIYMEYDVNIAASLAPHLVPEGLLLRVLPQPQPPGPLPAEVEARQRSLWSALEDRISLHAGDRPLELETRRYLVWAHYLTCRALLDAEHRDLAAFHLDRAMSINPRSPELWELARRLNTPAPTPTP